MRHLRGHARRICVLALPGLPEKGDAHDWVQAGGTAEQLERWAASVLPIGAEPAPGKAGHEAILCETAAWDEAAIPPRPWIARGYLLRGAVTVVIGAAGASKSTLMNAYAVGLALGEPVNRMRPVAPCRVMLFNVEDDQDEQRRCLSAVLTSMGHSSADIAGRVARVTPAGVGTLLERSQDPDHPGLRPTATMGELIGGD